MLAENANKTELYKRKLWNIRSNVKNVSRKWGPSWDIENRRENIWPRVYHIGENLKKYVLVIQSEKLNTGYLTWSVYHSGEYWRIFTSMPPLDGRGP